MKLEEFLGQARDGRIFTVEFVKKDGSNRVMNARLGVKAHLKGEGRKFDPRDYKLLGVFDMQKQAYRFINLDSLLTLKIHGKKYAWDNDQKEFIESENV